MSKVYEPIIIRFITRSIQQKPFGIFIFMSNLRAYRNKYIMCGINGIWGISNPSQAEGIINKMNTAIGHRGPDDEGTYANSFLALGHRRLSIIDLSKDGHQPFYSYDKRYVIVYNGELYNYKELKKTIQATNPAFIFQTHTDTEVVIGAYATWGIAALEKLNGMYAFAIWDNALEKLLLVRDRMGVKPLYYTKNGDQLLFSSEIKGLLASGMVRAEISKNALADYLRYQTTHTPQTMLEDVYMLEAGSYAVINKDYFNIHSYWNFPKEKSEDYRYEFIKKHIYELLLKSVERRMVADVPVGAFLSGGIDSSAIVGLMNRVNPGKINTFNVSFDESEFSEAQYARLVAKKFQTTHHEIRLKPSDFLDQLPDALKAMDHPSGDGINTYVVSNATKKAGITVALSGIGADELFAGYPIFGRILQLERRNPLLQRIPSFIRKGSGTVLTKIKPGIAAEKTAALLSQKEWNLENTYPLSRQLMFDKQIRKLMSMANLPDNEVKKIVQRYETSVYPLLSRLTIAESCSYLQNILLRDTDQMSMAVALEVREPFLDYELIQYVLSIPDDHKYGNRPKPLLVDALGDLLPHEIVYRPKMGFSFPWKHWIKHELKSFCQEKWKSLQDRGLLDSDELAKLWKNFFADAPSSSYAQIWYLVVLENWMQQNHIN